MERLGGEVGEVAKPVAGSAVKGEPGRLAALPQVVRRLEVGIAEQLADHKPAARSQHPFDLGQGGVAVGDLAQHGDQDDAVERVVLVRKRSGVAAPRVHVAEPAFVGAPHRVQKHLALDVEDLDLAVAANPVGEVERVVAGARPDLEQALTRLRVEDLPQPVTGDDRVRRLDPETLAVRAGGRVLAPPQRSPDGPDGGNPERGAGRLHSPNTNPTRCPPESTRTNATLARSSATTPSSVSRSCQPPRSRSERSPLRAFSPIRTETTCPPRKPMSTR